MPQNPDDEPEEPRADPAAPDSAARDSAVPDSAAQASATQESAGQDGDDSLLREMAQALDPTGSSPAGPGPGGGREPSHPGLAALSAGTLIAGRYRLDRVLGEGGMGEVWAATHAITRRRVAMKFVKGSATMRPEMRQRFLREARASSLVQHPGVVEVLDVFELDGGVPVMVMDLLVGETLGARLARDQVLAAGEAATLLLPAIEAIEAAHRMGIVHRDLKPDNIFLKRGEGGKVTVKVLDFGIAKLTATEGDAADTGSITGTGSLVGTPWYMAPEQCYGEKDIDPRADVWALGVILYECLAGQRPVEGSNVGQLVKAMLHDGIVPIEKRVPGLAPELAHLIGWMLSPERKDRPESLAQVREVLTGLLEKGRLSAAPVAVPEVAEKARAREPGQAPPRWDTAGPHSVPRPRASRSLGGRRFPAVVVAAAATVGVIGVLALTLVRQASPRATEAIVSTGAAAQGLVSTGTPAQAVASAPAAQVAPTSPEVLTAPPSESHAAPVDVAHPGPPATLRRTRSAADAGAGGVTRANGSGVASTVPPTLRARPTGDGGLFQEVPF